jgi:hypothetical protein
MLTSLKLVTSYSIAGEEESLHSHGRHKPTFPGVRLLSSGN